MQIRKVEVTDTREMWPFQYLRYVWLHQFDESKRRFDLGDYKSSDFNPRACEGWQKFKAAGFVFLAFWAESYLNYALSKVYEDEYPYLEKMSPKDKIELLCKKYSINYNKPVCNGLFNYRNKMAHGKEFSPDEIVAEVDLDKFNKNYWQFKRDQKLESDWERYLKTEEDPVIKELSRVFDEIRAKADLKFYADGLSDVSLRSGTVK